MKTPLTAALCLCALAASAQNLLVNGSFELPPLATGEVSVRAGNTNLSGWTLEGTNGSLYHVRGPTFNGFTAAHGTQYVDLNRDLVLSQAFPTVPGELYEVRFTVGLFQSSNMRVIANLLDDNGTNLAGVQVSPPQTPGWNPATTFQFTATTPISVLRFTETNTTVNFDMTLDDVSVERMTPRLTIEHSHVRLCWDSRTNATYQLQYRSELTTNMWTDLGASIPGTNGVSCIIEPVGEPRRLYRVLLTPLQ